MGAALKPPRVTRSLKRSVGAAAAVAEALLERREPALTRRLSRSERRAELTAAAVFLALAIGMAIPAVGDVESPLTAVLLTLSYALVRRVRFPLGPGLIRPTQLVFVPMLFLTPAAAVPALVVLGSVLGELPEIARHRAHPERVAVIVADGWYSIGPALVIAALGSGAAADDPLGVLVLALAAQIAVDLVVTIARESLGAGIAVAELLSVLGLVYLIDVLLSPIGFLAVLASDVHQYAYLLAIAPGALLGLITRERSTRIAHELALERAFRRSTRALDARAADLRRQAGRMQRGETAVAPEDRAALERILLATTIEALQADGGRLSEVTDDGTLQHRLAIGTDGRALSAAESALGMLVDGGLAIGVGPSHVLAVSRTARPFDAVERDLLEHLAAQAAVSLENLRLEELMRRAEAELRAILEGVADAIAAEDPDGRLVYVNAAAAKLLEGADDLAGRLGIAPERLPGRRVLAGASAEPLVVRHAREPRWSRVKASPVLEGGGPRLAISVIEDITEIKQAEEAQRFLAETSRSLVGSFDVEARLPDIARLAATHMADACVIQLDGQTFRAGPALELPAGLDTLTEPRLFGERALAVPIRGGTITLQTTTRRLGSNDLAIAEDLGLRVGAALETARLYRTSAAIAQTLQRSLLPPELPEIPGVETAALYRPAGEGNEVGGDFYDVFSTGAREWFAVMGDVCGKGAEAATVTALARYTIRAAVLRQRSPAGILRSLNAAMLRQDAGRFLTLTCVRLQLDSPDVTVTAACGGHPCPRVLRATGLVEELGTRGTLLGVLDEVEAEDRSARLAPGDAIVLYTDGLTESGAPDVWTPARLDAAVAGARRRDAEGIVEHLAAQAHDPLRDDLALLALRVQPLL